MMFGVDYSKAMHMFTDASGFAAGLLLGQYEANVLLTILYDSFTFSPAERRYGAYKRELLSIVRFAQKYDYILSNPYIPSVIHTDHKPLKYYQNSDFHDGIYARWAAKLREVNVVLEYIPGSRNTVADGLSRTVFTGEEKIDYLQQLNEEMSSQNNNPKWYWKDGPGGFEDFLRQLDPANRCEIIEEGKLHGLEIHSNAITAEMIDKYEASNWYRDVYRCLTNQATSQAHTSMASVRRIQNKAAHFSLRNNHPYRRYRNILIPCITENEVFSILKSVHDDKGHFGKAITIAQLKERAYWPSLSTDVEEYIKGCITCARHGPAVKSQTLSPVIDSKVFQLLGFDYIGPLTTTPRRKRYIFNVIEYLSRFIISYATETCSTDETIACLEDVFTKYGTPIASYTDRGGHFDNPKFQDFLRTKGIAWTPSPSGSSKSTGMIERSNGILESVLRKSCNNPGEWDTPLPSSVHNANQRIIHHLGHSPTEILLGIKPNPLPQFQAEETSGLINTLQSGNYIEIH